MIIKKEKKIDWNGLIEKNVDNIILYNDKMHM